MCVKPRPGHHRIYSARRWLTYITFTFLSFCSLFLSSRTNRQFTPDPVLYGFDSKDDLSEGLATFIEKAQEEAISKRGNFRVAISGGSLPATLGKLAKEGRQGLLWDKWCGTISHPPGRKEGLAFPCN